MSQCLQGSGSCDTNCFVQVCVTEETGLCNCTACDSLQTQPGKRKVVPESLKMTREPSVKRKRMPWCAETLPSTGSL